MRGENDFDELIDRALARYADAEPLAGLEVRILQRIRATRYGGGRWAWPAAAAAALLAALALVRGWDGPVPTKVDSVDSAASSLAVTLPAAVPQRWSFDARLSRRPRGANRLPKLENFPARTPMTEEERALVQLVKQSPSEAVRLFLQDERNPAEPIKVDPIQIDPLETGDSNHTNQLGEKGATD